MNIRYIRDIHNANYHCSLFKTAALPIGFDLEWKPTIRRGASENPVALIQLANEDSVLLLQLSAMSEFPKILKDILVSPDIVKAGVGIQDDVKKLYRDYTVSTRNCVDLSLLARSADNARWKGKYTSPIGLARLVEAYEQLTLPKGQVRRSNWEAPLTDEQQEYAANDARFGLIIYTRLIAMAEAMSPIPQKDYYNFDYVNGRLCEPSSSFSWYPHNPDYDPGPPPPPRLPKPPKASDVTVSETPSDHHPTPQRSVPRPARGSWSAAPSVNYFGRGRGRFPPDSRFAPQAQPRVPLRYPENQPRYFAQPHSYDQIRSPENQPRYFAQPHSYDQTRSPENQPRYFAQPHSYDQPRSPENQPRYFAQPHFYDQPRSPTVPTPFAGLPLATGPLARNNRYPWRGRRGAHAGSDGA